MNNKIYIPIGSDCKVTWYLHRNKYRIQAFPFDWTVTPIRSAFELINNGFENFLNKDNLIFLPPTKRLLFRDDDQCPELTDDIVTTVYDKKYHILYVHDFSKAGATELIHVKQKYFRRVQRLKEYLLNPDIQVFLIFNNDNPNEWQNSQYNQVGYTFKTLMQEEIENFSSIHPNVTLISLDNFKKGLIS
jgi:hypothetical protein